MSSGRGAYYKNKYGRRRAPIEEELPLFRSDGSIQLPYGGPTGSLDDLVQKLRSLEGASYGAYKDVERTVWHRDDTAVIIDRVQSDGFAPPTKCRVVLTKELANLPEAAFASKAAATAAADYLARKFFEHARRHGDDARTETGGWGGKKGGEIRICVPSQFVLERTNVRVSCAGAVEARVTVALPARGRTIEGRWAARVVGERLANLAVSLRGDEKIQDHVNSVLDQQFLRNQLDENNLVAFVADGSVLPRASGNDDRPMAAGAIPFDASKCGALRVTLKTRTQGNVTGLGLRRGVSLICGGGFHGKSTLLQALQTGCYDKIPGDGRQGVVTTKDTVKIRAEDGRSVSSVDISAFLSSLPVDTRRFSTQDASGSTSQAAAIAEALEVGATTLLFDEDTCATNFMIRDERMRQLVAKEPITPLVDRVRHLASLNVSSILVVGGTGDYLSVADAVVVMEDYVARDETAKAKNIAGPPRRVIAQPASYFVPRRVANLEPRGRTATRALRLFQYGDNNDVDLQAVEQLVEVGQTSAICAALATLAKTARNASLDASLGVLDALLDQDLDVLAQAHGGIAGDLARPRKHDIAAALNRLRTARFSHNNYP